MGLMGPNTILWFQYVDTSTGNWNLNVGNMVGIAITGFYLFQSLLNYFALSNASKGFTLTKEHLMDVTIEGSDLNKDQLKTSEKTILKHFRLIKSI